MLSRFFIHRPVFAAVVALLMVLAGSITVPLLPVEQYPEVTPPTVKVRATYPGADSQTLVDSVTSPLEQAINGVDDMLYLRSLSSDAGTAEITVTFALGTDPDIAAVQVQNRVAQAEARLPEEVRLGGISVTKESTSIILYSCLVSPDGRFDQEFLANYATLYLKDELSRIEGVGNVQVFGTGDFSMRIWLDPERLAARQLVVEDVLGALRAQNVQVAAGQLGAPPTELDAGFQYTLTTRGRLDTVEQFEDIVLKTGADRRVLRLRDVARVELGSETYRSFARLNGAATAAIAVFQAPGSNMVATATAVQERMDDLATDFPAGMEAVLTFDFTNFVRASIREVLTTLLIAVGLVILVTFIFLQDWRATLIPTIAIPVSLIGTFAVLGALGFTLNLLTLFGLILAIGIVVDDAIVVVENCTRLIADGAESARTAVTEAMHEITGPIVATTLVVLAVFVPAALLPGMTGRLYQPFAVTIAVATVLSSVNALTLSPALCALLLKPPPARRALPFRLFNATLDAGRAGYLFAVGKGLRVLVLVAVVYVGLAAGTGWLLVRTPTGFLPQEDMGYFFANVQLPDAARLGRTDAALAAVEQAIGDIDGVRHVLAIAGFSFLTSTNEPNSASLVVILEPWADRTTTTTRLSAIVGRTAGILASRPEAVAFPFTPPPIVGLGAAGGFDFQLQDRAGSGLRVLETTANELVAAAADDPRLTRTFSSLRASIPQRRIDVDRVKAQKQGVDLDGVFNALQVGLGGVYVNDLNLFGRVYRVYAQNDAPFREDLDDIRRLHVRNRAGGMVPLDTLVTVIDTVGPSTIMRYNLYPSASITGQAAPGLSSGEAITAMRELSEGTLPPGMGYEWTGTTYQEILAGNVAPVAFGLGLLVVFLVLAAQYESWLIPVAILLAVPFGVLGALLGLNVIGVANDIYAQIGLVLLIALVAKNAILVVEFAKARHDAGVAPREAALDAARLRFRPVLMTALSFILGVAPLLIARGAGAEARIVLGTTVFSGMILATAVGLVFTPAFYVMMQSLRGKRKA